MVTWHEKREQLVADLRARRQRARETATTLKTTARVMSLPVILYASPPTGKALYLRWFGRQIAESMAKWFADHPEALRSIESSELFQLSTLRQEELRGLAADQLFLPILEGARTAMRERDTAAVAGLSKTLTEDQAEAAVKGAEKLLNDPVVGAEILRLGEQLAGDAALEVPGDENLSKAARERRKHLLLALVWFFMILLVLEGTTLALPETAERIGEVEQHFEAALALSGVALYLHDRKWRDRQ